jgi:Tol biopolymer transport system component
LKNWNLKKILPEIHDIRNIVFSPDGQLILFTAMQNNISEVFIKKCDSNEFRQLTHTANEKIAITFSADGKQILFSEQWYEKGKSPPRTVELFSMDMDGKDLRKLTNDREYKIPVCCTSDKQVFYLRRNQNNELWVMKDDGSAQHLVMRAMHGMANPKLLPNANYILFVDDRTTPFNYDVYAVDLKEPYEILKITDLACYIGALGLSRSGKLITFIAESESDPGNGKGKIVLVDMTNKNVQVLGNNY